MFLIGYNLLTDNFIRVFTNRLYIKNLICLTLFIINEKYSNNNDNNKH